MAEDRSPPPTALSLAPLRREVDEVLSLQGREREARLLRSGNLGALVALMPAEEFYFTLKGLDPDNVPAVLAHARTEQVEFALDLELWRKDRLRPDRVLPWLERFETCGGEALERWLRHLDLSTWTLLLAQVARVRMSDGEDDPLQEAPGRAPFTLEGRYYLSASEKAEPTVRAILASAARSAPTLYARLVEALMRDVDSELEEACFQDRQSRLASRGFPPRGEALEVYEPLAVGSPGELPLRSDRDPGPLRNEESVPPRYPLAAAGGAPDFLHRALGLAEPGERLDSLWSELAYLTNKVAMADALDLDRVGSFRTALRKVGAYVSIGLELLTGSDENLAVKVLERHWLQHIFRVGWTPVHALRARARRMFEKAWPQGHKERLLFLDPPLPETLEGLLRPSPLHYGGADEVPPYRLFRSLTEVRRAERDVAKAAFLGRFLLQVVEVRLRDIQDAAVEVEAENLRGSTVFLTALANSALERGFRFAPVARDRVRDALARLWVTDRPPRRIRPEFRDTAVEWARQAVGLTSEEEGFLGEFVADCFALLEEQFGHLPEGEVPDPRFLQGIWLA